MSQIPSLGNLRVDPKSNASQNKSLNSLDVDRFLKLMIAQLQNQDPLNPLDNSQMLQQISQIRDIGATDRLTNTLDTLLLRQNVSSATSLIGQSVEGITDNGRSVQGIVDQVSITDGTPRLTVNGATRAVPDAGEGTIQSGTYAYKVVFESSPGQPPFSIDIPPVTTTGTEGKDRAIRLSNLPATPGAKKIYRTDSTGSGDYHFVAEVNGETTSFVDVRHDAALPGGILAGATQVLSGGREYTLGLDQVSRIIQPDRSEGQ